MDISIVKGAGTGPTKLAAFDAALRAAGIANFNIMTLSSVIPPGSTIIAKGSIPRDQHIGVWGDRLYVVMADKRIDKIGDEAWAGVGWVQDDRMAKGLFVEHVGSNKQTVANDINATLKSLVQGRGEPFGEIHSEIIGITCTKEPVCALVCAVYESAAWQSEDPANRKPN